MQIKDKISEEEKEKEKKRLNELLKGNWVLVERSKGGSKYSWDIEGNKIMIYRDNRKSKEEIYLDANLESNKDYNLYTFIENSTGIQDVYAYKLSQNILYKKSMVNAKYEPKKFRLCIDSKFNNICE